MKIAGSRDAMAESLTVSLMAGEEAGRKHRRSEKPESPSSPENFSFQKLKVVFREIGLEKIRIDRGTAKAIFRTTGNAEIFENEVPREHQEPVKAHEKRIRGAWFT